MNLSPAAALALQPDWPAVVDGWNAGEACAKLYEWPFWARPEQRMPPGQWRVWVAMAGRMWGKTRSGAEAVREAIEKRGARYVALVAPTAGDARRVMVQGESGILNCCPPWNRPVYSPANLQLTWPNGAIATTYSADEPERLRGPQHDFAWCDELGAWRYPAAWDMLRFTMRLGQDPRTVVTTTPRTTKLVRALLAEPRVVVTRGRTADNRANVAPDIVADLTALYGGTRLGRQELDAELLEDIAGALWSHGIIDAGRASHAPEGLTRVVVAIDPAVSSSEESDETGIIVAGKDERGHGYVLADASGRYAPTEWARTALAAFHAHAADRIVAEVNNGGEMIEATLRMIDPNVPFTAVHASRGKVARAEPVAALYEQGRVHHVRTFAKLEDQMCAFVPGMASSNGSPDRADALVWAFTDLLVGQVAGQGIFDLYRQLAGFPAEAEPAAELAEEVA